MSEEIILCRAVADGGGGYLGNINRIIGEICQDKAFWHTAAHIHNSPFLLGMPQEFIGDLCLLARIGCGIQVKHPDDVPRIYDKILT